LRLAHTAERQRAEAGERTGGNARAAQEAAAIDAVRLRCERARQRGAARVAL
jgi:hypothetical protein